MSRRINDPFPNYNFQYILEIYSIQVAGFTECSGLQVETSVYKHKEGGRNNTTLVFPEHSSHGNVTLKRGITFWDDLLLEWHHDIVKGEFSINPRLPGPLRRNQKPTAIVLLDEERDEMWRWTLIGAIPVKWVGPDLKATGNEIAIESLEIAYEGIEVE